VKTDTQIDSRADSAPSLEPTVVERLADVSKLAALVLGIFYVFGLLIVNMELGIYGVFSLGLDRPEYVLAGALWVFLSVFPIVSFRQWWPAMPAPESVRDFRSIVKILALSVLALVTLNYGLGVLSEHQLKIGSVHGLVAVLCIVFNSVVISAEYSKTFKPLRGQPILTILENHPR
jgi:hypothetical protein